MIYSKTVEFLNNTKPVCKICLKEVDNLNVYNNIFNDTFVFVAECHGKEDTFAINTHDIEWTLLEKGFAFNKKLIGKVKELEFKK